MKRTVPLSERQARLGSRHLLAGLKAESPENVVEALVALHSSDPSTVFLSVQARCSGFTTQQLEKSLYDDRSLARILGMRRTMWVVPATFVGAVNSSSTAALVEPERRRTAAMVESEGIAEDGARWVAEISGEVLQALERRGQATARELTQDIPKLGRKITFHKSDGTVIGEAGASTRILFLLATEGKIIRARPLGTWISSQYRWSKVENWLRSPIETVDRATAQTRVLEQFLRRFGPATETDMKWWTGWPVTQVRKTLESLGAVEVDVDSGIAYLNPDDTEPVDDPEPWVALLPSLDPTTMGWKERDWYVGEHAPELFDRSGNAGPTIWANGKIVGGWSQRGSGEVVYELFEDLGRDLTDAVAQRSAQLETWLGETRVTPRFRSPHDKRLSA